MTKPRILVTGAAGKTGSALVTQLRRSDWPVRAIVRKEDARSAELRRLGAEVVVADLYDPGQIAGALVDVRRSYYVPPFDPFAVQSAAAFVTAARGSDLEVIVGLGQWLASPNHPSLHTRQIWLIQQMLSAVPGVAHVNINPGYFADNYLRFLDFASLLGVFPILTGHSRNAPPSNEDIARVAAAVLMNPDEHAGQSYRPTGPRLLSAYDMLGIIRKVLGHPVLPLNLPWWMLTRAARLQGVNAFDLSALRYYVEDHKQGAFELGAPNRVVEELTGQPAEDFETTVQRYAALPFARKTVANRLRALINFNRVPFARGYNLDRYERAHFHPLPPRPQFSMEDAAWQAERLARANRTPVSSPGKEQIYEDVAA